MFLNKDQKKIHELNQISPDHILAWYVFGKDKKDSGYFEDEVKLIFKTRQLYTKLNPDKYYKYVEKEPGLLSLVKDDEDAILHFFINIPSRKCFLIRKDTSLKILDTLLKNDLFIDNLTEEHLYSLYSPETQEIIENRPKLVAKFGNELLEKIKLESVIYFGYNFK